MSFPYPPGDYGPDSVVPDVDGGKTVVAGDHRIENWLAAKGVDWTDVYRLKTFAGLVIIYRYANDNQGRKYLSRWRTDRPATRIPKLVWAS